MLGLKYIQKKCLNGIFQFGFCLFTIACGGYEPADESDLTARPGEIVGVMLNENGKSDPNTTIQLITADGTELIASTDGIDSDGRFGVFPPDTGSYNIIGIFGDTVKAIKQNVAFISGEGQNIGKVQAQKVALLSVQVDVPNDSNIDGSGVLVEVLGTDISMTTREEGVGLFEVGIPAGVYTIRLSKNGLETLEVSDVVLNAEDAKLLENIAMSTEN